MSSVSTAKFFRIDLHEVFRQPIAKVEPMEHRVNRLLNILYQENTVIVLDGIESLQHPEGHPRYGFINDPALRKLIEEFAVSRTSKRLLCLLTTRRPVRILEFYCDRDRACVTQIQVH